MKKYFIHFSPDTLERISESKSAFDCEKLYWMGSDQYTLGNALYVHAESLDSLSHGVFLVTDDNRYTRLIK